MKNSLDLKLEIISTIFLLLITSFLLPLFITNVEISWLIGIIIGIASLSLIATKVYLHLLKKEVQIVIEKLKQDFSNGSGLANSISYKLSEMPEPNLTYAKKFLRETSDQIDKIQKGVILLNEAEYFDEIINESKVLNDAGEMFAVNTFDERRFFNDPRERIYFKENVEAVMYRGAIIKRIFVFDERQVNSTVEKEKLKAIKMNYDNNIKTFVVLKSQLRTNSDLCIDWVMFGKKNPRLYIDYQDKVDETRVAYGELRINETDIEKFKKIFVTLENMAINETEINLLFNKLTMTDNQKNSNDCN